MSSVNGVQSILLTSLLHKNQLPISAIGWAKYGVFCSFWNGGPCASVFVGFSWHILYHLYIAPCLFVIIRSTPFESKFKYQCVRRGNNSHVGLCKFIYIYLLMADYIKSTILGKWTKTLHHMTRKWYYVDGSLFHGPNTLLISNTIFPTGVVLGAWNSLQSYCVVALRSGPGIRYCCFGKY